MTEQQPAQGSVACNLDWLRYTCLWGLDDLWDYDTKSHADQLQLATARAVMPLPIFRPVDAESRPQHNYNRSQRLGAGTLSWHSTKPEQRIMVELNGGDLADLRTSMIADEELITYVVMRGHRVTRLDLALDYYALADPMDFKRQWQEGKLITRAKDCSNVEKHTSGLGATGTTVYLGDPSSLKRLKVYNKRLQLGTTYDWTRIELTLKDESALVGLNTIAHSSIDIATKSLILAFVKAPELDWWNAAMAGKTTVIEPERRKDTDTEKWLRDDVAPVLHRVLEEKAKQGDYFLFDRYVELLDSVVETELSKKPQRKRSLTGMI